MILSAKRILTTAFLIENILMLNQHLYKPFPGLPERRSMEARSGQNRDNKIALHVNFHPTAANIMDLGLLHILSSINNTFFSVLVIIFRNRSYFCFNNRNTFFIHAMNYFSVVLRIIFLMCVKNYFFNWAENYFSRYREFIFRSTMHCGRCIWSGMVRVFDFLGRPFWKLCKWRSAFKENAKAKHCQGKKKSGFHLSYKIYIQIPRNYDT